MNNEIGLINSYSAEHGWIVEVYNYVHKRTKYSLNEIRVYEDEVCEIDAYDKFGYRTGTAIFSKCDLSQILKHKWYIDSVGYVSTTIDGKKVRLHRLLFPESLTDHFDNDKLNNTRENLQQISHRLNIAKIKNKNPNPHGVTGIFLTPSNSWQASIMIDGKRISKNFSIKENAILMRYIWELNYLGKNAPQLDDIRNIYPRLVTAMGKGYKITENVKLANAILAKVNEQLYCPCTIIRNEDTKCMCKEFREMKSGVCHCGLYEKYDDDHITKA